jgi:hypothetical protein
MFDQFFPSNEYWILLRALPLLPVATHNDPFHATLEPEVVNPPDTAGNQFMPSVEY